MVTGDSRSLRGKVRGDSGVTFLLQEMSTQEVFHRGHEERTHSKYVVLVIIFISF